MDKIYLNSFSPLPYNYSLLMLVLFYLQPVGASKELLASQSF